MCWAPSTPRLRRAVPLPVPGRNVRDGFGHVQAPGVGFVRYAGSAFGFAEGAASTGVKGAIRAVGGGGAGGDFGGDGGAGAEAGVDEVLGFEVVEGFGVKGKPMGLADDVAVPGEAEPAQVFDDAFDELLTAAAGVDILDAQQEAAATFASEIMGLQGREGMAEMQASGRAGRETTHNYFCFLLRPALTASRALWCHDAVTFANQKVAELGKSGVKPLSPTF